MLCNLERHRLLVVGFTCSLAFCSALNIIHDTIGQAESKYQFHRPLVRGEQLVFAPCNVLKTDQARLDNSVQDLTE